MTKEYIGIKQVTAWPQDKDGKPGYAVKYADGYTSWSPKDVFEAAYLDIGHVSHLPAHQQRVIGERAIINDWFTKLGAFLPSDFFKTLPGEEQTRLSSQWGTQMEYLRTLDQRIEHFEG